MKILVVDVGGTSVKILATGQKEPRKFPSGPDLTPDQMVGGVKREAKGWDYDVVSVGYPGPVLRGRPRSGSPRATTGPSSSASRSWTRRAAAPRRTSPWS